MASVAAQIEQALALKEHLAEEILINKQAIIDFDRKRNSNREALTQLKRIPEEKKVWTFFGDMFIKLPSEKTRTLIQKDQELLDEKVDKARSVMKENAMELQKMEGKNDIHGFSLKGLTATDLYNNIK
ncbi:p53 and DNA damage-regulated protein 1-like protein [Mycotypha africana]|uniref:p53 and DNA damage-regulated protein 1-like protein n=1 Tax=Mycotypha africana TaxID=64632 RepID=UPI0023008AC0|nr:p53 and DNA damage-regulated protein 1-like protein [Mycotypha africana]KAI8991607.1 p53 and DNA damage-regulated protein 1-like protein [Mycotypha africana]